MITGHWFHGGKVRQIAPKFQDPLPCTGPCSPFNLPPLALRLLVLHCLTITLEEIQERQEQLRQEILERECLLAALEVLQKHAAPSRGSKTIDIGALFPALLANPKAISSTRRLTLLESAPVALPPPPPPEPYIHPELKQLGTWHGSNTMAVQWAIDRLTSDYTLKDIHALLKREGRPLQSAEISVILSRLKTRGPIVDIRPGNGRKPSIFRKPQLASNEQTEAAA